MEETEGIDERRVRRAKRREKQRLANHDRALTMRKARLQAEKEGLVPASEKLNKTVYIGCSGWFYWHWRGGFYPEESSTSEWFSIYQKNFKTVELNAPFYSWPTISAVKGWLRQEKTKNFIYTVKVCELITHIKKFSGTKTLIKDFSYIADLLGPQMGCFLFQLPPSYQYTPARLEAILGQLDLSRRNVIEFRHKSWWNDEVYRAFTKAGVIFCSCSGPRLPDELVKTADDVYVRFHGVKQWYRHNYSMEELKTWARKIKESKAKRAWIYFNNDRDEYAIRNAKALARLLKK